MYLFLSVESQQYQQFELQQFQTVHYLERRILQEHPESFNVNLQHTINNQLKYSMKYCFDIISIKFQKLQNLYLLVEFRMLFRMQHHL